MVRRTKNFFTIHDDVKKVIRSFKLSKEDQERVFLYYDEHGNFVDCPQLTADQIKQLKAPSEQNRNDCRC